MGLQTSDIKERNRHTPCPAALWLIPSQPSSAKPPPVECLWLTAEQYGLLPYRRLPSLALCAWFPTVRWGILDSKLSLHRKQMKTVKDVEEKHLIGYSPQRLGQKLWRSGKILEREQSFSRWLHPWTFSGYWSHLGSLASTYLPHLLLHTTKDTEKGCKWWEQTGNITHTGGRILQRSKTTSSLHVWLWRTAPSISRSEEAAAAWGHGRLFHHRSRWGSYQHRSCPCAAASSKGGFWKNPRRKNKTHTAV